jgi:alpha-tubulin suppressor-like RCC1 family protein
VQGLSTGVQAITAGYSHSCALTSAGAKCWGNNYYGELGNNSTTGSPIPVAVQGL